MNRDDVKIIEGDWDGEQLSRNDLRRELQERQARGELDRWSLNDYIEEITGKNGQCHWIKK